MLLPPFFRALVASSRELLSGDAITSSRYLSLLSSVADLLFASLCLLACYHRRFGSEVKPSWVSSLDGQESSGSARRDLELEED